MAVAPRRARSSTRTAAPRSPGPAGLRSTRRERRLDAGPARRRNRAAHQQAAEQDRPRPGRRHRNRTLPASSPFRNQTQRDLRKAALAQATGLWAMATMPTSRASEPDAATSSRAPLSTGRAVISRGRSAAAWPARRVAQRSAIAINPVDITQPVRQALTNRPQLHMNIGEIYLPRQSSISINEIWRVASGRRSGRASKQRPNSSCCSRNVGGKRRGAGRPPKGARAGSPHKERPYLHARYPVHVVLRVVGAVGSLRRRLAYHAIREATLTTARREDVRIVQLSIQRTHLHLLV